MTSVRKAVIPAAGLGTRFLPATKAVPKEMLAVVDKPAIQYVVEEAARAGIEDILIITGRSKKAIEDHFDRNVELEADLHAKGQDSRLAEVLALANLAESHYVRQGETRGLGHAVGLARRHVGDDSFAVMLGDDIMDEHSTVLSEMITHHEARQAAIIACKEFSREEISAYGSIAYEEVEERLLKVHSIVEKPQPQEAPSTWGVMGRYVFSPSIFAAIDRTPPGAGGEVQLTDAIGRLLDHGDVYGYTFSEGRYDIGNKLDYLRATVELALAHPDLGVDFRAWLSRYVREQGIV